MKEFFEYLASIGITAAPDTFSILGRTLEQSGLDAICDIAAQCYVLSETASNYPKDTLTSVFQFSVGSSVSGGVRPCSEIACRVNNLYDLAIFSALYAERVYIPNPFEHLYGHLQRGFEFDSDTARVAFVNQIAGDIVVMFNLKPLIEGGIVRINPQFRSFCKEHWGEHVIEAKTFQKKMGVLDPRLIKLLNEHVRFEMKKDKTILLHDPQKYTNLEVLGFIKFPENLTSYLGRAPYIFSPNEVEALGIWQALVIPAVNEVVFQKYSMFKQNASYLTSYGLEKDIIDGLSSHTEERRSKELFDALIHELPFVSNVTIESLMQLRREENEVFEIYRDKLSEIIRNIGDRKIGPREAREIIQDEINPQLHKIDQVIKSHSASLNTRAAGMIIFDVVMSISAGIFGDWRTSSGLGGLYALKDILGTIFSARTKPLSAVNEDLFFLWSVRNKAR